MASSLSLPSSPMSSSPSSPSSLASDASSDVPLPWPLASDASSDVPLPWIQKPLASDASSDASIQKYLVASVDEVRRIIRLAEPHVHLQFRLAPDTSLAEAHRVWDLVSSDDGGHGELTNPDLLGNKEEALRFVRGKLDRLQRLKNFIDRNRVLILGEISRLEKVIEAGGPGVPLGFEAHRYAGLPAVLDADQAINENELEMHIAAIQALFLQGSPASPAAEGNEGTAKICEEREEKEQLTIARFNLEYLELKAQLMGFLSVRLEAGIRKLEEKFINFPTHLGAGDANFVRFTEVDMYPDEGSSEA